MDIFNVYLPIAGIEFNVFLLFAIGFCVGVLGGFFGVGGAWIVTPALNIFGFHMAYAIGTDLAHMFGKSIISTRKHAKMGNVDWKLGFVSIIGSVIGVEIGAQLVMYLEKLKVAGNIVRFAYIILLIGLGLFMLYDYFVLRPKALKKKEELIKRGEDPETIFRSNIAIKFQSLRIPPMISFKTSKIESISIWIIMAIFLVTGFLSGFLGVGGGFVRMPCLVYLVGCPTAIAVGTDLMSVLFTGAYGCFSYALKGRVEIVAAMIMLMGAAIGAQIGVEAVKYIKGYGIRLLFAIMILLASVSIIFKQIQAIFHIEFYKIISEWVVMLSASLISLYIIYRVFHDSKKEKLKNKQA